MDTATAVRIADARERKAARLADAARHCARTDSEGYTAAELEDFTDAQWAMLETIAGTRQPASKITRGMVIVCVRNLEQRPAVADEDLFDGLGR